MIYIIEHLEQYLSKWCLLEYKHISQIVGREYLMFTNIKKTNDTIKLKGLGKIEQQSVRELTLPNACVLDPNARATLSPKDKHHFNYLIFGGILGDAPQKHRTKKELTQYMNVPDRNLGDKQMSTDTAVFVAKKIINGTPLNKIPFRDNVEIELKKGESIILPFRYVLNGTKPMLPKGLVEFLKAKKGI